MKFRCPVCTVVLTFDGQETEQRITCPACETSFKPDRIRQIHTRRQQRKWNLSPQTDESATGSDSAATQIRVTPQDEWFEKTGNIASNSPSLIQRRRRNSNRRLVGFFVLLFLAMGSTGGLIYVLRHSDSRNLSPVSEPELSPEATAVEIEKDAETNLNESDTPHSEPVDELPAAMEKQAAHPFLLLDSKNDSFRQPDNSIKSAKLLDDCWFKVRPFLVEIRAETPLGSQLATGTIVDSRGWILTSYRAVAGAKQIDIRQARKSIPDETGTEPLVDQVRGFIAADLEHDLVLLSINPRFVVTFNDLPLASDDKLVGSQFLIQCMPPTQSYPWPAVESRIDRRATLPEMDSGFAEKMVRLGFRDDSLRWVQHQQMSPLRVGAPLFNDEFQLVAMNTAVVGESEQDVFAVPAKFILDLKKQGHSDLQALPVPQIGVDSGIGRTEHNETAGEPVDREMTVVHSGSSLRELSEALNRLGSDCQLFRWWPTTETETQQLAEFTQLLIETQHRMQTGNSDLDHETLRQQIADWTGQLAQQLANDTSQNREAKMDFNQRLATAMRPSTNGESPFIGFAFVEYSAMESPRLAIGRDDAEDSIVFEFTGSDKQVITNLSIDWPPLPPDSLWLIIGERLKDKVRLKGQDQDSELVQQSKVHFVFQAN